MKALITIFTLLIATTLNAEPLNYWLSYKVYAPINKSEANKKANKLKNGADNIKTGNTIIFSNSFVSINPRTKHQFVHTVKKDYVKHANLKSGDIEIDTATETNSILIENVSENEFFIEIDIDQIKNLIETRNNSQLSTVAVVDRRSLKVKLTLDSEERKLLVRDGIILVVNRLPNNYGLLK